MFLILLDTLILIFSGTSLVSKSSFVIKHSLK